MESYPRMMAKTSQFKIVHSKRNFRNVAENTLVKKLRLILYRLQPKSPILLLAEACQRGIHFNGCIAQGLAFFFLPGFLKT